MFGTAELVCLYAHFHKMFGTEELVCLYAHFHKMFGTVEQVCLYAHFHKMFGTAEQVCLYAHFHKMFAPLDWQQIACLEKTKISPWILKMQRRWTIFWRDHYILLIFFFTFCHLSIFGNQRRYLIRLIIPCLFRHPALYCINLFRSIKTLKHLFRSFFSF